MYRLTPHAAGPSLLETDDRTEAIDHQWGTLELSATFPPDGCAVGTYQTVHLRFTVGSLGFDENAGLRFSFRFVSDMGRPQTQDPTADDYVSARTSGDADLDLRFETKGNRRPFQPTLFVDVRNAALQQGDTIDIVLGDTSGGSRGWRQQTFVETPFPILVAVDPLGTHDYQDLPRTTGWNLVPASLHRYVVHTPSHAVVGEPVLVRIKGEDEWGNPLRSLDGGAPVLSIRRLRSESKVSAPGSALVSAPLSGPLSAPEWSVGEGVHSRGVWSYEVRIANEGHFTFFVVGSVASIGNPVVVRALHDDLPGARHSWCDLHGQTGETVGVGTVREYFDFARHFGFLDGSVHQGNDFQISAATWAAIKSATEDAYEPGAFVAFHGYEWSGTTAMGGDHNVLYNEADPPIYRSTGWLDGNPFEETAPLAALYQALAPHEAMTIAHIGGRPASLEESDPAVESLMELHSAWGTFEWVYREAFERGFKIGFVCNSDGHKCRPGASYPGAGIFGTLGGLTCVLSESHDRDGFWRALRERRTYGTTGQRIIVEADMNAHPIGAEVRAHRATVRAHVVGTAPITRVELFRGAEVVQSRTAEHARPADTMLLRFGGARVKGRARLVRWTGSISVEGNTIRAATMNGVYGPVQGIRSRSGQRVEFDCVTTGNLVNLEVRFEQGLVGRLRFDSGVTNHALDLESLTGEPMTLFRASLDQRVEVSACERNELPEVVDASFEIEVDHAEELPYFLRITQLDEGKAWTSPFYLARP